MILDSSLNTTLYHHPISPHSGAHLGVPSKGLLGLPPIPLREITRITRVRVYPSYGWRAYYMVLGIPCGSRASKARQRYPILPHLGLPSEPHLVPYLAPLIPIWGYMESQLAQTCGFLNALMWNCVNNAYMILDAYPFRPFWAPYWTPYGPHSGPYPVGPSPTLHP